MLTKRIIPCLDVKNGRVVKGVNFVGLRDAGDPVELATNYNNLGADEICFLDITATVDGRNAMLKVIEDTARQVFIPLTVGGGVNTTDDIGDMLRAGADKVGINSGAVKNPQLVQDGANQYGTQCIVVAIDVKLTDNTPSNWEVFVKGGREPTGIDAVQWAKDVTARGAGEILLTSMDADGTKAGYDLEITNIIASDVNIPVIASGGAGSVQHIVDVLQQTPAEAALLASLLHFQEVTIQEIKDSMIANNIPVRKS